jgi:UDP-glucose 4-epimerase
VERVAPKKALVVGLGFLGRRFALIWSDSGVDVRALTRSAPEPEALEALGGMKIDVADAADTRTLARAVDGVDHVVYAAGGLMPAESEANPSQDVALTFPPLFALLDILNSRREVGLTLLSSGGTVYGAPSRLPVSEDHPTEPLSAYGVVKLAVEKFVAAYSRRSFDARILRCSNVYGEGQPTHSGQGAIGTFVDRMARRESIVLYGDGSVVRDYIHVDDVATAALALAGRPPEPQVVNVGSGQGHSLREIVSLIEELTGTAALIERRPPREFDVPAIVLDVSRLAGLVDFRPLALRDGIARVAASHGLAHAGAS